MMRFRYEIECAECNAVIARTDDPREAHSIAISESSGDHSDHTISVFARGLVNRWRFGVVNRGGVSDEDER